MIGYLTGIVLSTGPLSVPAFTSYGLMKGAFLSTEAVSSLALYISKGGISTPAAMILETVQGEGGINAADYTWLKRVVEICKKKDILLIVDDVQTGCGRTGTFFSFENAGIEPDIVCLSKSISGYGLPMALTLIKPELDIWKPGEHNGTFRGNNLAFVTAAEALTYWEDSELYRNVSKHEVTVRLFLEELAEKYPKIQGEVRGRGLMMGIAFGKKGFAEKVCRAAFEQGLIIETSGVDNQVAKVMPPLTIDIEGLIKGLHILAECVERLGALRICLCQN